MTWALKSDILKSTLYSYNASVKSLLHLLLEYLRIHKTPGIESERQGWGCRWEQRHYNHADIFVLWKVDVNWFPIRAVKVHGSIF